MAKSRKLEQILTLLSQVQSTSISEEAIATLRQIINSKYAIAVAKAAKIDGEAKIYQLFPDLVAAFDRFMIAPEATDQNWIAKKGIAQTLY